MWKPSSTSGAEDDKRSRDSKPSHIPQYGYKSNESGRRDREYNDKYHRHDPRNPPSRPKQFSSDSARDNRYHDKRYNTSSNDEKHGHKYQKIRHGYGDYESNSDRNYDDQSYESRRVSDKYRSHHQRGDYKGSKRSHHTPPSPQGRYSPFKSHEKSSSFRKFDKSKHNSSSPKTPASDGLASMHKKFSPPPLPPFEPPGLTHVIDSNSKKVAKFDKAEVISTFAQFYETKRIEGKYKEYGPDPRLEEHLYGSRVVSKFDLVTFPPNPNIDTTLDSPKFTLDTKYRSLYTFNAFFQTPLEMINNHLFSPRPKIQDEWWLKGTLSLLLIGIPRNCGPTDVVAHLIAAYQKLMSTKGTHQTSHDNTDSLFDDWASETEADVLSLMKTQKSLKKDCSILGISKFILLFGDSNFAINEIPLMYPIQSDSSESRDEMDDVRKKFIANDHPDGMGLLVFNSEEQALKFWSVMSSNLVQAYPSTIRLCPDPSGWRIYSEALALSFKTELLTGPAQPIKSPRNDTIDLLSVLTTPNASFTQTSNPNSTYSQNRQNVESPVNRADPKANKATLLMYVCSYVTDQDEANLIAKSLNKFGIKCMYHKPSKIMSLQFPDEKTLNEISFGRRLFITHTGSRVPCCFIKCDLKAIPILKRANVEHLSNSFDKKKNLPAKNFKFKLPLQGILNVEDLTE